MDQQVSFFFDPISPYAWLGSKELPRLEAVGLKVIYQPVLFAGLLNAHGQKGPAEIDAKRAYIFRDVSLLAAQRGYPLQGPPTHPFNPLQALRMCCALEQGEARNRLAQALLDAAWQDGKDITDVLQLADIARQSGFNEAECAQIMQQSMQTEAKQALQAMTNAAIAQGVFGVPSFLWQGELFWGCDRVDSLLWRVAGNQIDEAALRARLQRPASAQRKQAEK